MKPIRLPPQSLEQLQQDLVSYTGRQRLFAHSSVRR